jgi:hypothetical protein
VRNDTVHAIGRYLERNGQGYAYYFYGPPNLFASDATISFIGRDRTLIEVPEGAQQIPDAATSEEGAAFLFLPERTGEAAPIMAACPAGTWTEFRNEGLDHSMFFAYELPEGRACVREAQITAPLGDIPAGGLQSDPQARDEQRRHDLEAISAALERHRQDNQAYPTTNGFIQSLCAYETDAGCALRPYVDPVPVDPRGEPLTYGYFYASDGSMYSVFSILEEGAGSAEDCPFYDADALPDETQLCASAP